MDRAEPSPRAERIGILGGTFDPPHVGHLAAARACRRELDLDRVLLIVANHPWQKVPTRRVTPAEDRYAMVEAATAGDPGVEASRMEIDRGGPSYTIETVEELLAAARSEGRPDPELFLIIGSDLVATLHTWHRVDELARLVTLAVVARPPDPVPPAPAGWTMVTVDGEPADVSSSEVRRLLRHGRPVEGKVPEPVIRCIARRALYAVPR